MKRFLITTLLSSVMTFVGASTYAAGDQKKNDTKASAAADKQNLVDISQEDLQKVQNRLEKLNHLSVKFDQLVYTPLRKKTIPYSGHAEFSRPAMFRWEQETPIKKQVIYDGKDLYMYFPDQKVAQKFSAKGSQASEIEKLAGIVLSINSLLELYKLDEAKYDTVKKVVYMSLSPKSSSGIKDVDVEVNTLKDYIKKVKLTYADGKVITYQFSQPKRAEIEAARYSFAKPKGVKLEVFD